ncbi:MAG TPA: 3' terminal RNA ribose 2'-O-methyltransferase Hen1 [Thermoanaerobaculia bacterium]|nr:3' terminal RNA ribose 2'-O-methyltransferase Hen1 [Thermoanaerobaculia bacterium]
MLLTLRTTHSPATDLGYLLHKPPDRVQSLELSFGHAHVFYPEADETACTAAVLLDVDPVGLVRGEGGTLDQYVNDRPYVASSFLSVAIARLFGTAMGGRSQSRPELAATPIPLEAKIAALPCRGGEGLLRRLFEPLGYKVAAEPQLLDLSFPEWGPSPFFNVALRAVCRLCDLLTHLYVLIPVLDAGKHDWVGEEEVEKLVRHGEGWLASHPERDLITRRYLKHKRSLVADAVARLVEEEPEPEATAERRNAEEADLERPLSLNDRRLDAVLAVLRESGARRIVDLGCGEGNLLARLLADPRFEGVAGMDVSVHVLDRAVARLGLDRLPPRQRERIKLFQGSLSYRDARLAGFDAAAVVEVVEHLDPPRLAAFERVVFEFARPGTVVLTTPNADYNVRWPSLPAGRFRHRDHRFEWTREELRRWAEGVAGRFGYAVRFLPVGEEDPQVGPPTQMAVFSR